MNGRNDFLHGNVDPKLLTVDQMGVDRFGSEQEIPLFRDDRSKMARYLANALKCVEPGAALRDFDVVTAFIEHVLSHLTDEASAWLKALLGQDYLGLNNRSGEIAQLFEMVIPEVRLIIAKPSVDKAHANERRPMSVSSSEDK